MLSVKRFDRNRQSLNENGQTDKQCKMTASSFIANARSDTAFRNTASSNDGKRDPLKPESCFRNPDPDPYDILYVVLFIHDIK
jgi:hypothetical protein